MLIRNIFITACIFSSSMAFACNDDIENKAFLEVGVSGEPLYYEYYGNISEESVVESNNGIKAHFIEDKDAEPVIIHKQRKIYQF